MECSEPTSEISVHVDSVLQVDKFKVEKPIIPIFRSIDYNENKGKTIQECFRKYVRHNVVGGVYGNKNELNKNENKVSKT